MDLEQRHDTPLLPAGNVDVVETEAFSDPRPAVGGWHADQCKEYYDYTLRSEIESFIALYGLPSFIEQAVEIGRANSFSVELSP